jgi:hypothetical protein
MNGGAHPLDTLSFSDLSSHLGILRDWMASFETFSCPEALDFKQDIQAELDRGGVRLNMLYWERVLDRRRRAPSATKEKEAEKLIHVENAEREVAKYGREWEAMKAREEGESRRGKNTDR